MRRNRHFAGGWMLKGIDPESTLVRQVGEVAARDGMSLEEWLEHWLRIVLEHHYSTPGRGSGADSPVQRAESLKSDMRQNLKILGDNLTRIRQAVERTHDAVERAELGVHTTERHINRSERNQQTDTAGNGMT